MKKRLLSLIAICISAIVHSQTFSSSDSNGNVVQYNVTSATTVQVNGITLNNINVDIPSAVTNGGTTYSVTRINDFALGGGGPQISSIILPNTLISIGQQALSSNNLTGIVFPNSLTTIEDYAFQNNQLQGITIPGNVTSIGNGVFRGNPLTTVTSLSSIPPSITTVAGNNDSFAISGDRSGINLFIPAGTTGAYVTDSGALWTGFNTVTENLNIGDTYVDGFITYEVTSAALSTVKAIDYDMLGGTMVTIPASIQNGLATYNITEIGNAAFFNKQLTSITIGSNVTSIGLGAFQNNQLTNAIIPDNVTTMANQVFGNNQLTSISFGSGLTTIAPFTCNSNSLTSVTIPDNIVTIGARAFDGNPGLANLTIGSNVTSIGDYAFRNNLLTNVVFPDGLVSIGLEAFFSDMLTDITIPSSVTSIGNRAFDANPLTDVTSEGTTPPMITTGTDDTFGNRSTIHLHIPAGTLNVYVTTPNAGADWTGFNPVTEDALSISDFALADAVKIITTSEEIRIISANNLQLQNYTIFAITGAQVASGSESEIVTSKLTSGIYVLQLEFDQGTVIRKVVVN